jgi:CheY-like chemotaxis protein
MDTPQVRITQWSKDGSSLLTQLLDVHSRATAALEETQRECAKLRTEIASLREEHDRLQKGQSEVINTIAAALSTATAALRRAPNTPEIARVSPVTATAISPAAIDSRAAAPASSSPAPSTTSLPTGKPGGPGPARGATPRRVLVVDDEEAFRSLVATYLGDQGYEVTIAASGEEALTRLEKSSPQLVLLDLRMPGIGGIQALQKIKARYPDLCVVMVTAESDRSIAQEALALGATDYLKKPFDLDYLDAVLQIYMPGSNARSATVRSTMAAAEQGKALISASPPSKNPG